MAQYSLGNLHYSGEGVQQDFKEAARWFRKAGEQGLALAQHSLGVMYASGDGVPSNDVKACAWYIQSAFNGHPDGVKERDLIAKKMTPEQIAQAQALSKKLMDQILKNKKKQVK